MDITRKELMETRLLTNAARNWAYQNLDYLNSPMRLLGTSRKVEKGSLKRETYILYLQPAGKVARRTLCVAAASSGCEGPCLISSGQLGMSVGQRAATKRTILLLLRPEWFRETMLTEIDRAERRAQRTGIPALFRLNGTSDTDFSDIIGARPHSEFYDYTKVLSRIRTNTLENYHLTFSGSMYSDQSRSALRKAVQRGHNIAVAYNTKDLEGELARPLHLEDFDKTDLRPLDAPGSIGTLSRKGSSRALRALEGDRSFFVTAENVDTFNDIIARG
jgi:hypothetical protein